MAAIFGNFDARTDTDDAYRESDGCGNSEPFDEWLIAKSFSLLVPICRIGLMVVCAILFVVEPLLYGYGVWGSKPQHLQLVSWHVVALLYFLTFHRLAQGGSSHARRSRCLMAFFIGGAALFSWFAFVSWSLSGDLSIYGIFLLTMVCVFAFPGRLRKVLNVVSTLALMLAIFLFDPDGTFRTNGAVINLVALAFASLLIDGHLMNLNRALFAEQQLVEYERARADRVLYNALPRSIANELKNGNAVKAEKFQHIAVLFVDMVGFTSFSAARRPDEVVEILNGIFCEFDALVDRHGVEKIKTIGDAYMVVGKGPLEHVAQLALDMVDAVRSYTLRHGYALDVRCGIHAGAAVAGVIGHKRFLYDVWGDAVNTASRMESTGEPGRIQVSEAVYRKLRQQFDFEARGEIDIKGKGPMRTFFLKAKALT
ncbi:MAG: adenylate/guanylate cyclase domain-containing protein [Burkholderiaceae bacterium]